MARCVWHEGIFDFSGALRIQRPPFRPFGGVRGYLAYNLSLRDLEEMMAERGANLDHSTVHRGVNNRIEQDHRGVKRRIRPMLGCKAMASAKVRICGIQMVQMIGKLQARSAYNQHPSLKAQFELLAARAAALTPLLTNSVWVCGKTTLAVCSYGPQCGKPSLPCIEISSCESMRVSFAREHVAGLYE